MFNHPVYAEPFKTGCSGSCPDGIWISPRRDIYKRTRKCVPVLSLTLKGSPDVQREPPMFWFVAIASGPVTGHHWKIDLFSVLFIPFLLVLTYIDEIPPSLLSQAEPSQLFSLSSQERCSIPLITLVDPHWTLSSMLSLILELDTVFQAWPYWWLRIPS